MAGLSIIVTVYNLEKYLDECFRSLLRQGLEDYEIIVVNDGSTDSSAEIIDSYTLNYPGIFKAVHHKNQGPGGARNAGIDLAAKEYLTFLDGDDYITDGGYAGVLEKIVRDQADMAIFEMVYFYPNGEEKRIPSLPTFLAEKNAATSILAQCGPCNKVYKRKLWEKIRFPEDIWYEDLAVIPAFAMLTDRIVWYDDWIYMYRQRDYSITSKTVYSPKCMDIILACDNIYALLKDKGFESELEYLMLFQLCYYASFRFLPFKKYEEIEKCIESLNSKCPDWRKNSYYISRPRLFKMYCELLANGHYAMAGIFNKAKMALGK